MRGLVSHLRYALDRIENDKVLKNVMLESVKADNERRV